MRTRIVFVKLFAQPSMLLGQPYSMVCFDVSKSFSAGLALDDANQDHIDLQEMLPSFERPGCAEALSCVLQAQAIQVRQLDSCVCRRSAAWLQRIT